MSHTREQIYARDGHICRYCGIPLTKENRTLDHILPKSKGGKGFHNFVSACRACNYLKGNKLVSPLLGIGIVLKKVKQPPPKKKERIHTFETATVHKQKKRRKQYEINWE